MNKRLFIAGNWKSNKTIVEAKEWVDAFKIQPNNATVVLCVPFTLLSVMKSPNFRLSAQNISPFPDGAYTGEVSARQVKEVAEWVIIGHSERRNYFGETDDLLVSKVERAKEAGLQVIFCVQDEYTLVPDSVSVVAYEPIWAIGTGKTETPENANAVISKIKEKTNISVCIYGGSVTHENVRSFVDMDAIDGVLPGGASLDPKKFSLLIEIATL